MAINDTNIINALVYTKLITQEDAINAKKIARHERLSLLEVIGRNHKVPRTVMYESVAAQRKLPFLRISSLKLADKIAEKIPTQLMLRKLILPVFVDDQLTLAMADPDDQITLDTVKRLLNCALNVALAEAETIEAVLEKDFDSVDSNNKKLDPIELFDEVMKEAYVCNASDIHIKPEKYGVKISLRVDGRLLPSPALLNQEQANLLINRIKVLSGLDISEQRVPQDGGFSYEINQWNMSPFDLRVATLPCRFGERVTLRILGQESELLDIHQIDLNPTIKQKLTEVLKNPNGLVLVTGPTGSGKSTSLYAALRSIDRNEFNVLTVEDPIEQQLEDATQVQVGVKVSFATALRSFLRHDPDVILVGEIRDFDTAETALKASMTGHLVLSTLHTNNATATIDRLKNLGCERFMVASTVRLIIAQRLVRRLCTACKMPENNSQHETQNNTFKANGCPACMSTGYKGRLAIHEMLWVDEYISKLIIDDVSEDQIRQKSGDQLLSLWQDAFQKYQDGLTSMEEILPFKPRNNNVTPNMLSNSLVNEEHVNIGVSL